MKQNRILQAAILFLTFGLSAASAQIQDATQNNLLNGIFRFRHIAVLNVDKNRNPSEIAASSGTIAFDGAGNYLLVGATVDNTISGGLPEPFSVIGKYAIASNGTGYIANPLYPNDPTSYIYGAAAQGIFTGSSTEAWSGAGVMNDIFIAIPAGTPTNAAFTASYQVGLLDFANASASGLKNALFKLAPDGTGKLLNFAVSGQAKNQGTSTLLQSVSLGLYNFALDGAGTLTIPLPNAVTADNALFTGVKTIYQSADGNFVLGWTPAGYDIFFGVKSLAASVTNANSLGLYFTAGLEDLIDNYGVNSWYGAINNTGNVTGDGIVHQRVNLPGTAAFDLGLDNKTLLSQDGSVGNAGNGYTDLNAYRYQFGAGGQAFVAIGTKGNFSLQTGIHAASFSGGGVYLNPLGVVNAASLQPVTASIAPGELLVLFGTGLSSTTLVTQGGQTFPTSLGGVSVTINGLPCPIYYVSPTQLSVIVPYAIANNTTGLADIQVTNNQVKSNVVQVYLATSAPGSFTENANGIGYARALHAANGQLITPANPVLPGETISLYVTGLGLVSPGISDGAVGPSNPLSSSVINNAGNLHVYFNDYVNGSIRNEGTITYAGLAPTLGGLYQINVTMPSTGLVTGVNIYVEFATDATEVRQMQIPYGANAVGGRAVPGATRAQVIARRIKTQPIQ